MKYMIHTYPKRMWYVINYIVPDLIKQGVRKDDIQIISDSEGLGNLEAFIKSLDLVEEDTWHLQDDILISKHFKDKCEVLGRLGIIVTGFVHYEFNSGSLLQTGFTKPLYMFMSFPCIFIPKRYSDHFKRWIRLESTYKKYKERIDTKKNDDWLFYRFMCDIYPNDEIYNTKECLVDHVDYLIGGSSINNRINKVSAYYWNEFDRNKELEAVLKNDKNKQ